MRWKSGLFSALLLLCGTWAQDDDQKTEVAAEIPEPSFGSGGWARMINLNDGTATRYLYATVFGPFSLRLNSSAVTKKVDLTKVTGMKVSFKFYTDFDDNVEPAPFIINVATCYNKVVKSVAGDIITARKGKWEHWEVAAHTVRQSGSVHEFNINDQSCLTDVVINVENKNATLGLVVAVKDVNIEYTYTADVPDPAVVAPALPRPPGSPVVDPPLPPPPASAALPSASDDTDGGSAASAAVNARRRRATETKDLTIGCTSPDNCPFEVSDQLLWSKKVTADIFATAGSQELVVYAPTSDSDLLQLQFSNQSKTSDYEITIRYLITEQAKLLVENGAPVWKDFTFKLSDVNPNAKDPNFEIYIKPVVPDIHAGTQLAVVGQLPGQAVPFTVKSLDRTELIEDTAPTFFASWDRTEKRSGQWTLMPDNVLKKDNEKEMVIEVKDMSVKYVVSEWYRADPQDGGAVSYKMALEGSAESGQFELFAVVVDGSNNLIATSVAKLASTENQVFHVRPLQGEDNLLRRVVFRIKPTNETAVGSKIVLSRVSFGDLCAQGVCVSDNTRSCDLNDNIGNYTCNCYEKFRGKNCQLEDYCVTEKGNQLCGVGVAVGVECIPYEAKQASGDFFQCKCPPGQEWNAESKKCLTRSPCDAVTECSKPNTRCDYSLTQADFDASNPCTACIDGYTFNKATSECDPVPLCEGDGNRCTVVKYPGGERKAIFSCPDRYAKSKDAQGKVTCKPKFLNMACPQIIRTRAGCKHDCRVDYNVTALTSDVVCTCFHGWTKDDTDSRVCNQPDNLKCGVHKTSDRLCVKETQDASPTWRCPPGFYQSAEYQICEVDYCEQAKNDTGLQAEIQSVCGASTAPPRSRSSLTSARKAMRPRRAAPRRACSASEGAPFSAPPSGAPAPLVKPGTRTPAGLSARLRSSLRTAGPAEPSVGPHSTSRPKAEPKCDACQEGFYFNKGKGECQPASFVYETPKIQFSLSYQLVKELSDFNANKTVSTPTNFNVDECENAEYSDQCREFAASQLEVEKVTKPETKAETKTETKTEAQPAPSTEKRAKRAVKDEEALSAYEVDKVGSIMVDSLRSEYTGYFDYQTVALKDLTKEGGVYSASLVLAFSKSLTAADALDKLVKRCQNLSGDMCSLYEGVNLNKSSLHTSTEVITPGVLQADNSTSPPTTNVVVKPIVATEVNPCDRKDYYCPQHSTCRNANGKDVTPRGFDFDCVCDEGFEPTNNVRLGDNRFKDFCAAINHCDRDPCDNVTSVCEKRLPGLRLTCENGGSCYPDKNSPRCACADGWTGTHCQEEVNLVASWRTRFGWTTAVLVIFLVLAIGSAVYFARKSSKEEEADQPMQNFPRSSGASSRPKTDYGADNTAYQI
ncbi:hypothetical protein HDE_09119 [Halotydeus destructor]|nr:hypothetical protein HDE_09119 [Halotydeus destructor]